MDWDKACEVEAAVAAIMRWNKYLSYLNDDRLVDKFSLNYDGKYLCSLEPCIIYMMKDLYKRKRDEEEALLASL